MSETLASLFQSGKFPLIVSLPINNKELAAAAIAGGADALKVHLNVHHYASGTCFGTFEEEKPFIGFLLETYSTSIGILPGETEFATLSEMQELEKMGIDFMDCFYNYFPEEFRSLSMSKMLAPGHP